MRFELVEDTVALDLVPHLAPLVLTLLREHVASDHSIVLIRLQLNTHTHTHTHMQIECYFIVILVCMS